MRSVQSVRFPLLVALTVVFGCSGASDKPLLKTVKVTGIVKYNGAPVSDATITFHPKGDARAAYARTDSEGRFSLTTRDANDGALAGDYRITVSKITDENAGPPSTDIAAPPKPSNPKSWLPAKYSKPETSDLTFTVKADGPNEVPLDLKD